MNMYRLPVGLRGSEMPLGINERSVSIIGANSQNIFVNLLPRTVTYNIIMGKMNVHIDCTINVFATGSSLNISIALSIAVLFLIV